MSLLIKGMDMPKSCGGCDICDDDFWFHCPVGKQADGRVLDLANYKDEFIYTESRHPDCPLREIPTPHGQLIDADMAIKEIAKAFLDKPWGGMDFGLKVEEIIDNIPEIIEAEE